MAFFVTRITETVYQESAPRVDAEAGILYGVKLLGEVSKNGRRYKAEAMQKAVPLYEGRKSFVNHPERDKLSEDRKFGDLLGVIRNVRYEAGKGVFGDAHLLKNGDYFGGIIEAAEKFPTHIGFSHVADGDSRMEGTTEIIESISEVFSVDLVTDPATTAGFFESHKKKKTVRDAVESLPADQPLRKRLIEMIDAGYMDGRSSLDNEHEKPTDPLTQLIAVVRDMTVAFADSLKALADANKAPAPIVPPVVPKDPNADAEKPPEDEDDEMLTDEQKAAKAEEEAKKAKAFESLQRENAELKAKNLLLESGRDATPPRIKALAATVEAEQKSLLESWPQLEEAERPQRSPPVTESTDASPERIKETFAALSR